MQGYNAVQYDRQWIRRIMREEKTLIDAFNETPQNPIDNSYNYYDNNSQLHSSNKVETQSNRSRSLAYNNPSQAQSRQSQRSNIVKEEIKHNEYDDLDSVSRVSVQTPKTHISSKSKQSQISKRSGVSSVGRVTQNSMKTTTTTRDQLAALQVELEREKQLRWEAEKKIQQIKTAKKKL